jgi:hypothetical protein
MRAKDFRVLTEAADKLFPNDLSGHFNFVCHGMDFHEFKARPQKILLIADASAVRWNEENKLCIESAHKAKVAVINKDNESDFQGIQLSVKSLKKVVKEKLKEGDEEPWQDHLIDDLQPQSTNSSALKSRQN